MGSFIELNDTLRIDESQGFPVELDIEVHLKTPYKLDDFKDRIFEFHDKPEIRVYKIPPVRNFLVQDIGGKWLYWGLIHILEINHDYLRKKTSGKFKIIYINTPEEMKMAYELVDRNLDNNYFHN